MRSDPWACGRPPATRGWGTGTGGAHRRQSLSQAPPAGSRDRAAFRVRVLRCAAGTYATQWRNMMAQTLLNQIVALEKGVKSRAYADFTAAHHQLQKTPLLSGISRTYKPKDDEGEQLPPESTRVQLRAAEVVKDVERALTRLFDVTLTKAVATEKHPAQVEMYFEDVLVGYWTTVKFSGALPQARVSELKARVVKLAEAVKVAREAANSTQVTDQKIGDKIFGYLFA